MLVADALCRRTCADGQCLPSYVLLLPLFPLWEGSSEILMAVGLAMAAAGLTPRSILSAAEESLDGLATASDCAKIPQRPSENPVSTSHLSKQLSPALSQPLADLCPYKRLQKIALTKF